MDALIQNLRAVTGRDAVLSDAEELLVYDCDGLPQHKYLPRAVVFPDSTEEVAEVVRVLTREGVPFAPRGAGTGLSGGALAVNRAVVIELARMRRLLKLDEENQLAVVQTGMVNAQLSQRAAPFRLHYVPDPSSQATCTIGGNIAENAGGIHCLKYGMTVDHVLAARVVLASGEIVDLGSLGPEAVGYDLLGVFVGSEGTFGIATEATLRLSPIPSAVRTLLADFADVNDASRAVSAVIATGLVPAALEMVDGETIRAVEASVFAAGLPLDAEAALLIELDGFEAGLDEEAAQAEGLCRQHGARSVRLARDETERKKFWAARKGAFGAMGRVSPDLMLQDAVVPRSRLPEVLAETYRIGAKYHLRLANLFHAGDGNLHPVICFDSRLAEEVRRVKEAGREIMETCVRAGGTITGEHGVGLDKSEFLPLIFSADDMDTMLRVRAAFDPTGLCNPGKIIPTSRSCGEAKAATRRGGDRLSRADVSAKSLETEQAVINTPASGVIAPHRAAAALMRQKSQSLESPFQPEKEVNRLAQIVGEANVAFVTHRNVYASPCLEVAPASVEESCEVLRLAARARWAVVPFGAGTWLDAGNTLRRADLIVSTRRMRRIVEHEPADLVATAQAGVRLEELNATLGCAGQWLPLDPPDDGRATIGGVVATGLGGAHSVGYGTPRSSVIGMRVALADGRVVKAGGRVVKNVAGYDLCKLFTGSFGTLGLILELTFKLRPRPARTVTIAIHGPLASLLSSARSALNAHLLPVAFELISAGVAERLSIPHDGVQPVLLVSYAGAIEAVAYQIEQTLKLPANSAARVRGATFDEDEDFWRKLAALPLAEDHQVVWRAGFRPTALATFLESALQSEGAVFPSSSLWHAGLAAGRLRVMSDAQGDGGACVASLEQLRTAVVAAGGSLVIERAPREIKSMIDAWGDTGTTASLMRRVKTELDPHGLLSPGRFVTGI